MVENECIFLNNEKFNKIEVNNMNSTFYVSIEQHEKIKTDFTISVSKI